MDKSTVKYPFLFLNQLLQFLFFWQKFVFQVLTAGLKSLRVLQKQGRWKLNKKAQSYSWRQQCPGDKVQDKVSDLEIRDRLWRVKENNLG